MRAKISQREARDLRKRVRELEDQRAAERSYWRNDSPGVHLGTITLDKDWFWGACRTAQRLGRVLVVKTKENGTHEFYAVK
jgi:hypothetical protein